MYKRNDGRVPDRASLWAVAVLLAIYPSDVFAYIDPGSGSLLLQIVMSAVFGALFLARNFLAKTAAMARRLFQSGKAEKPEPPNEPGA